MRSYGWLLFFSLCSILYGKMEYEVPFLTSAPIIDGVIGDNEWNCAVMIEEFYQTSPGDNTTPSEKTEFFIGYDFDNIYCLVKCYAEDLQIIRDFHCSRDNIMTTDRVFIFLDTFHSNEKAYYFGANVNGEQADGIVIDDIDTLPDLFYYSRGTRMDFGYLIEFAIPLNSIKYRSGKGVTWGTFIKRHIPERGEEITSFPVLRGRGNFYDNYGILKFAILPSSMSLKINPSLISRFNEEKNDILGIKNRTEEIEPEFNLLFEPGSMVSATVTVNPDFNIIEADALNVEVNNRYDIYYPEKRPFFVEGANPYETSINILYTRQIVEPAWGAKISSSLGRYSLYGLVAVDKDVPGDRFSSSFNGDKNTPFAFICFSRKLGMKDDRIRLAGSLRKFGEYDNLVINLDNFFRLNNQISFYSQMAASGNEIGEDDVTTLQRGYAYAAELNYYDGTWYIHNFAKGLSTNFRADLGYITETDLNFLENRLEYQIHSATDEDLIRYLEIASTQNVKYDFKFDRILTNYWEGMGGCIFKNNMELWTGLELTTENYLNKDYHLHYPWLSLTYNPRREIGINLLLVDGENLWFGEYRGETGDYRKLETTLNLRPSSNIDLEFKQKYHETRKFYIARTYECKLKLQFHRNFWLRTIIQITDSDIYETGEECSRIDFYPLFTFKPNANTAVYLGATRSDNRYWLEQDLDGHEQVTVYFLKLSCAFDII
ncbi:MAG: hypothetical protein JXB60_07650 [Candidatus Cloacimonetes bacterium]|nr:hypothetical protein [Candidatus Cloacimonadota bacterium]